MFSRRSFFPGGGRGWRLDRTSGTGGRAEHSAADLYAGGGPKSTVAIVKGDVRRKIVPDALNAIDHQIRPVIQRKKYVIIKVNNVSTTNQLAATHADTIWGILDYLQPKYKLPVSIVESSAGDTMTGFQNFGYAKLAADKRRAQRLADRSE